MKKIKFVLVVFIFIFGLVLGLCVPRQQQSFHVDDEEINREQMDFILPSQEIEDTLNTESLKTEKEELETEEPKTEEPETEEPETEWIPDVRKIKVYVTTQEDIDKISELATLKSLDISISAEEMETGVDLSPLGKLNNLSELRIFLYTGGTVDLSFIEQLSNLQSLSLDRFTTLDDLAFLERMTTLNEIYIEYVEDVDLSYLQNNHKLLRIHICGGNIRHMESLGQLKILSWVYLVETREERNEREVLNLEVMSNMKLLDELSLTNIKVDDVSPLSNLDELRFIYLENTGIENIEPLKDLKNLSTLHVMGNESELVKEQASKYFNHVAHVNISEKLSP